MSDEFTPNQPEPENSPVNLEKPGEPESSPVNLEKPGEPENSPVNLEKPNQQEDRPLQGDAADKNVIQAAYERPQQDGQTAYQQAYGEQSYYGQAKEDETGFGIASLVLGILSVFTFACCVNYILALLAIIFGIVQMVKSRKKGFAIAGIITAVISIILGILVALGVVGMIAEYQDSGVLQKYIEQYEDHMSIGDDSF